MLRRLLVILMGVLMPTVGLAATASAAPLWADEAAMIKENPYRISYIYRLPAGGTITYERFAAPDVTAFYGQHEFDKNFMYWAPIVAINRPHELWNGCNSNPGGLCPSPRSGTVTIDNEIGSGQIHVKWWNGAFIGIACGNWNHSGAG